MVKEVDVGLLSKPLTVEEVEELLSGFEEVIREFLEERLGRRLESLDVVIEAELLDRGKRLRVRVDVKATGRLIAPLSYDEVLAEAIDAAARWLERKLRARVAEEEGSRNAGDSRVCRDTSCSNMSP